VAAAGEFTADTGPPGRPACPAGPCGVVVLRYGQSREKPGGFFTSAPATGTSQHVVIAPVSDYGAVSFDGISIADGGGTSGGMVSPR
jgi:hypothetical protein